MSQFHLSRLTSEKKFYTRIWALILERVIKLPVSILNLQKYKELKEPVDEQTKPIMLGKTDEDHHANWSFTSLLTEDAIDSESYWRLLGNCMTYVLTGIASIAGLRNSVSERNSSHSVKLADEQLTFLNNSLSAFQVAHWQIGNTQRTQPTQRHQ